MKSISLVFVILFSINASAQSDSIALKKYEVMVSKIKNELQNIKNISVLKTNKSLCETLFQIKALIDKLKENLIIKNNENNFDVVESIWNTYYTHAQTLLKYRDSVDLLNNADFVTYNTNLNHLKQTVIEYKNILFPDHEIKDTLKYIKGKTDIIFKDNTTFHKLAKESFKTIIKGAKDLTYFTDTSFSKVKKHINVVDSNVWYISKILETKVLKDLDSIKYFMFKRDTSIKSIACFGVYRDGLYSASFIRVLDTTNKRLSPLAIGVEILFPIDSRNYKNVGFAGTVGFQHKDFLVQTGILYFNNSFQSQNVGWKAGLLYHPYKSPILMGIAYSPLTSLGISIGLNIKIKPTNRSQP